jgi:hypothetical protein
MERNRDLTKEVLMVTVAAVSHARGSMAAEAHRGGASASS